MPAQAVFLGCERPALQAATSCLAARFRRGKSLPMAGVTIVTPTSRAAHRLQVLLADCARTQELAFVPPRVVTVSRVPELLYPARLPFASLATQQLAWAQALQQDRAICRAVVPAADRANPPWGPRQWLDAGVVFWRMYRELAAEGLSFKEVASLANRWPAWPDAERWQRLAALQAAYWKLLRNLGLWDKQSARLLAVEKCECRTEQQLILIGASDINRMLRSMLKQVQDHVTVLVHAPQQWCERFDEFGVLRPEAWENVSIDLQDSAWSVADNPESQAEAAVDWLAGVADRYAREDVVVGCADARLVPYLQRQLATRGVETRWVAGRAMAETAPFLLLSSIRKWLGARRREDFAELARHPDLIDWLLRRRVSPMWLAELDKYHEYHLARSYGTWLEDKRVPLKHLPRAYRLIRQLLRPLLRKPRRLGEWMEPLRAICRAVYRREYLDRDDPTDDQLLQGCQRIASQLDELAAVPPSVTSLMEAGDAIDMVLAGLESTRITPAVRTQQQVDIVGWLDLPLDDAPAVVVCGVHEGTVPRAITSDQFLPNPLRQRLGIDDARDRYARDAYALATLLGGPRQVHFVVGRTTAEGDPLRPSRLLLAAEGDELVRRWAKILTPPWTTLREDTALTAETGFDILRPSADVPLPETLSVSAFKTYLQCPFRFYLKHVLQLEEASDARRDMSPWLFGEVVHDILDEFGRSDVKDTTNPRVIREFCRDSLKRKAAARFGRTALPAVQIQLVQIAQVLSNFATAQAARSHEGWRIEFVEQRVSCCFVVDNQPMRVKGRIDRIDQHAVSGQWAVLDYKTSREAKKPGPAHRGKDGKWRDLQLPLYRHLGGTLGIAPAQLGYFAIPTNDVCKVSLLEWGEQEHQAADEKIHEVIRDIRAARFWPPRQPRYDDEWRDICMVGTLERPTV